MDNDKSKANSNEAVIKVIAYCRRCDGGSVSTLAMSPTVITFRCLACLTSTELPVLRTGDGDQ